MKKLLAVMLLWTLAVIWSMGSNVEAGYVNGYYKSNWTYVNSYYRANPNAFKYDNKSYKPSQGLYNKSYSYPTKNYSSSRYNSKYSY